MRRLGLIGPVSVVVVTLVTAAIVLLGPEPFRPANVPDIIRPGSVLDEVRDRWVLVAWWLVAAIMTLVFAFAPGLTSRGLSPRETLQRTYKPRFERWVVIALGACAIGIVVVALLGNADDPGIYPGATWSGYGAREIVVGLLLLVVVALQWSASRGLQRVVGFGIVAGLVLLAIPAMAQPPGGVRDPESFPFVLGDLMAVSNGQLPLADYFPQYSSLLGFPMAPVVTAFPEQAVWISLGWLLLLQVATIVAAIALARAAAPRWMTAAACLVIVPVVLATTDRGFSPVTYFAGLPLRTLLPVATLAVAARVLMPTTRMDALRVQQAIATGVLAGLAVVNNPEFGAPALAAVLLVAILATRLRAVLGMVGALLLGTVAVVVAYCALVVATGHELDPSAATVFTRLFGPTGFLSVAMRPFGIHVAFVALFVAASALGATVLLSRYGRRPSWLRRQAIVVLLAAVWPLLALPYFVGRSLTSTMTGGFSLSAAIVVAAFLPVLHATARSLRMHIAAHPAESAVALVLGCIGVVACLGLAAQIASPRTYIANMTRADVGQFAPLDQQARALEAWRAGVAAGTPLAEALAADQVQILLPMAAATSNLTGLPSQLVLNDPSYFTASLGASRLQCEAGWPDGTQYVVMSDDVARAMALEPACAQELAFADGVAATVDDRTLIAVPLR